MIPVTSVFPLLAQAAPAAGQSQPSPFGMLVPMILMFVVFYFIAIRPQRKKQQELQNQINAMKGGDSVVTSGGIHGVVSSLQERTITLKIADNVKIKVEKTAIAGVTKKGADAEVIEVSGKEVTAD